MNVSEQFQNRRKTARLAGLAYLTVALAALPDMLRKSLFVMDDPVATGRNLLANASLFRMSVIGDIITEIAFLFAALWLYRLLREVRQVAALAMLAMVAIAVTMTISATGIELAAMRVFEASDHTNGLLLLGVFQALIIPASVFFGLWMLPLGYLFVSSGFMPKTLGIALMIGSAGYVIHAGFAIMAPGVSESFVLLSVVAEIATILWLLVFGVKRQSGAAMSQA